MVTVGLPSDHWAVADPDHHHQSCSLHLAWVQQDCGNVGKGTVLPVLLFPTAPSAALYLSYKVTCMHASENILGVYGLEDPHHKW